MHVHAFGVYAAERSGAPLQAYVRVDDEEIYGNTYGQRSSATRGVGGRACRQKGDQAVKYRIGIVTAVGLALSITGCDVVLDIILPSTVTITLVNDSAQFRVDGTIVFDDDDPLLKADLIAFGTERDFDLEPGESFSFPPLDCDEVQALILQDADLRVIGGVGPETDSDILRMGDDFECGNEIVFTFSGGALDFDVSIQVR